MSTTLTRPSLVEMAEEAVTAARDRFRAHANECPFCIRVCQVCRELDDDCFDAARRRDNVRRTVERIGVKA